MLNHPKEEKQNIDKQNKTKKIHGLFMFVKKDKKIVTNLERGNLFTN